MAHVPPVKIYDRPEAKGVPPLYLAIAMVILLVVAFFAYKLLHHAQPAAVVPPSIFLPYVGIVSGWSQP